ncbi:MAG: DUF4382 domain-containing protein, partial [Candidatus Riflebacteria bacterium]|nr:DUF4382 domain-containing protein [Candidatus Riflebacteria bacterium]
MQKTVRSWFGRGCWTMSIIAVVVAATIGCGGGGGTGTGAGGGGGSIPTGEVSFGLTDAPATAISVFAVEVSSIRLSGHGGVTVNVLPQSSVIDFADLNQLSELLTAAQVPSGTYTGLELALNFASASTQVVLGSGNSTSAGTVQLRDTDGAALGALTVRVQRDRDRPLVVLPGLPAHVVLDFDLNQSCLVDETVVPNVVTVRPVFSADARLMRPLVTRIRGLMKSVDIGAKTIVIEVRVLGRHA